MCVLCVLLIFFFFNDTATTEIYTLSLHDALPISPLPRPPDHLARALGRGGEGLLDQQRLSGVDRGEGQRVVLGGRRGQDRKSTRLNSSHAKISDAVFCLKKKKKKKSRHRHDI